MISGVMYPQSTTGSTNLGNVWKASKSCNSESRSRPSFMRFNNISVQTSCSFLAIKTPIVAIMEIRPCFNSTDRRRLKAATSPSEVKPTGSQKPTGACTPSSFSKASQYDPDLIAKSPNGFPVRPSCHVTCALSLQRLSLQISSQCSADAHSTHSTVIS